MHICSMCGSDNTVVKSEERTFEYKGDKVAYTANYVECHECEFEFVPFNFKKREEGIKADLKRSAESLLTSVKIKHIRAEHGLTQEYASKLFGGGKNAFSKYERGEVLQSKAMDKLLRLVDLNPHNLEILKAIDGSPKKAIETPDKSFHFHFGLHQRSVEFDYDVFVSKPKETNTYQLKGDVVKLSGLDKNMAIVSNFSVAEDEYVYH
ncbi:type II toxin-antitoxin system MqsA family antitoxin [Idiomarina sp. 28-8]|uniref:type II toxin-antitoxin system MqsA family antitoxin n=1 Tax=Idiomarina sp. 28-8 TaxID=1260624 RepID=UPI00030628D1|nr:type II toxin-antitoxin system MqsA family antitoxin [Idiomarina sp. 28-8]